MSDQSTHIKLDTKLDTKLDAELDNSLVPTKTDFINVVISSPIHMLMTNTNDITIPFNPGPKASNIFVNTKKLFKSCVGFVGKCFCYEDGKCCCNCDAAICSIVCIFGLLFFMIIFLTR